MYKKTILISGCSSGIGRCAAEGLAARGYRVFATARKAEDVAALNAQGLESLLLDLNDSASVRAATDEVLARSGGELYALFNNGAYGQVGAVEDLRREVLHAQFETNVYGWLELTNLVLPVMRRQGYGRIIQNSSVLGFAAMPLRGAYTASKFAIEGLTDSLRLELAGTGIFVSLIEPGPIATQFRANCLTAYKRNIDPHTSLYRDKYLAMEQRLVHEGPASSFTLPPEAVLKKLVHALESPRPKIRYYVTFPTYLLAALKRVLPSRLLDRILYRIT
ncbi:MAG: SDR family NAD(P)-dependent oxidoreductase [Gammaproteobacteria bacterium]|nr:SDR family NAD(P)-dependent oxidoreductase [Gammaproteobacteria bacterium]